MPYTTLPNGQTLHHLDTSPPSSSSSTTTTTPILLIHGLGSSQNYYLPILPYLTGHQALPSSSSTTATTAPKPYTPHRCIAIDLPNSARSSTAPPSSSSPPAPQTITTLATTTLAFLASLHITDVILVGHSMSGILVPAIASLSTHPSFTTTTPTTPLAVKIKASVLIGPIFPSRDLTPTFTDRAHKVTGSGMEAMADVIPHAALALRASGTARAFVREVLLGQDAGNYAAMCGVIASAWRGVEEGVLVGEGGERVKSPDYAALTCPTLVIAGDEDKSAPLAGCERILAEMTGVAVEKGADSRGYADGGVEVAGGKRIEVVKGCGHWHCVERPEETAEAVGRFLGGLGV